MLIIFVCTCIRPFLLGGVGEEGGGLSHVLNAHHNQLFTPTKSPTFKGEIIVISILLVEKPYIFTPLPSQYALQLQYQIFHILVCFNRSPQSEHLCSLKGPHVWKVSQRCVAQNNGCRSSKCNQMEKFKGSSVCRRVPFVLIEDIDKFFLHELKVVVLEVGKGQAITRCKSKP